MFIKLNPFCYLHLFSVSWPLVNLLPLGLYVHVAIIVMNTLYRLKGVFTAFAVGAVVFFKFICCYYFILSTKVVSTSFVFAVLSIIYYFHRFFIYVCCRFRQMYVMWLKFFVSITTASNLSLSSFYYYRLIIISLCNELCVQWNSETWCVYFDSYRVRAWSGVMLCLLALVCVVKCHLHSVLSPRSVQVYTVCWIFIWSYNVIAVNVSRKRFEIRLLTAAIFSHHGCMEQRRNYWFWHVIIMVRQRASIINHPAKNSSSYQNHE